MQKGFGWVIFFGGRVSEQMIMLNNRMKIELMICSSIPETKTWGRSRCGKIIRNLFSSLKSRFAWTLCIVHEVDIDSTWFNQEYLSYFFKRQTKIQPQKLLATDLTRVKYRISRCWLLPGVTPAQVVYLGTFPEIEAGDVLEAAVTMQQSEENSRQYKISIETI